MKRSTLKPAVLLFIGAAVLPALAQPQAVTPVTSASAAPAPDKTAVATGSGSFEDWTKQVKNPVDWFSWGADVRLRNEYVNNAATLNESLKLHEQDYFRFRERLWLSLVPVTNVNVNARMTGEEREWTTLSNCKQYGARTGMEAPAGERGLLRIFDLANLWSAACIQTEDLGIAHDARAELTGETPDYNPTLRLTPRAVTLPLRPAIGSPITGTAPSAAAWARLASIGSMPS